MNTPRVYIAHRSQDYMDMFYANGWEVVDKVEDADIVQFTGGADVSPELYGEATHPRSYISIKRDLSDIYIYNRATELQIPKAGICRGGQFLNVMSGGSMWQDVDNHAIPGTHKALLVHKNEEIDVSSTHHQMMRPSKHGYVLMTANLSSNREGCPDIYKNVREVGSHTDVEAVYYKNTDSLCYQPHPEFFNREHECQKTYFELIFDYLL